MKQAGAGRGSGAVWRNRRRSSRPVSLRAPCHLELLERRWLLAATTQRVFFDYLEGDQLQGDSILVDAEDPYFAYVEPPTVRLTASRNIQVPRGQYATGAGSTLVWDNGPSANRVDVVFVGDGYTADEIDAYAEAVERIVPQFFRKSPLDEYASYFNVHRVDVVSPESGVDNDPVRDVFRDTALDMRFFCNNIERLLCINVTKALDAAAAAPEVDQVLAIANTQKYGGAGYASSNLAVFSSNNVSAIEIGIHEFGHAFADLADEYDTGGPVRFGQGEPSEPNVSIYQAETMLAQQRKWHRWLDLPEVDTFEGGKYSRMGIYRPTINSLMRSLGAEFGPVNAEQMIWSVYRHVEPIDDATAAGSYDAEQLFFVTPLHPLHHELDVQWYLDGMLIPEATDATFVPAEWDLAPGEHELSVKVVDNTPMVRDPMIRSNYMTARRSWTITVPVPQSVVTERWVLYAHTSHPNAKTDLDSVRAPRPDELLADSCPADLLCGKQALLPGQTASIINTTSNLQGLTGVAFDLKYPEELLTEADLQFRIGNSSDLQLWAEAPRPESVVSRIVSPSPRVARTYVTWPAGTILNQWLEVTVLATERTGLSAPDIHYWGHQLGQVVPETQGDHAVVDDADWARISAAGPSFLQLATWENPLDLNRDGLIDGSDLAIVRDAQSDEQEGLLLWTPPVHSVNLGTILQPILPVQDVAEPMAQPVESSGDLPAAAVDRALVELQALVKLNHPARFPAVLFVP